MEILNAIFHRAAATSAPDTGWVLSKVLLPSGVHQSRPIVIFSCLYRVWASVTARQILQQWAPNFPQAISGSMPHRACRDVSYRQQWKIEASLLSSTPLLGLSIDIIKCFNQIGWAPAGVVLRKLGVPAVLVDFWLHCLRQHTRSTVFCGSMSTGIVCHNGAPEGDPMSVVAMAGICYIANLACATQQVEFESYVDNWCWLSGSRPALAEVVPKALSFLECLALPINLFPAGCAPKLVTEVKDLGVAFKFDRHGHRTNRNQRLQEGHDRLDRLRQQPRTVLNKARLVQTGIWTQCLYGSEGHSHSLQELVQLRGKAARAIVGQHKIMSPHLALVALAEVVQDPFMYCLERQLSAFRRTCLHDPELAFDILQVTTRTVGPARAHLATALRVSLDRLGLTLQTDTCLKGLDNSRVRLDTCSMPELRDLLHRSWTLHVQGLVSHRNGLLQAPPIYSRPAVRLLGKFKGPEQAVIMRHVTGSFSSAAAKQQWAHDSDGLCPLLCGHRQTKFHKVVECPALEGVRAPWLPHLRLVLDRWPSWVHCPITSLPADLEVTQLIFHTRRLLQPQVEFSARPQLPHRGFLRMYTDGSCRHSGVSLAHHAGFAVVLDTSADDTVACAQMQQWRETGQVPAAFAVIVQGLVPGPQTSNRAELCAVLQAIRAAWQGGFQDIEI